MIFWLRVSQWYSVGLDKVVVRRLVASPVLYVGGRGDRDAQVRQDVQRAQTGFIRVFPDDVRAPPAPGGLLTVDVDQLVVVVQDVVGDAVD